MIKKLLFVLFIFGAMIAWHFSVVADVVDNNVARDISIYRFHLFYDNGQLFANRDFKIKYDIIPNVFVPESIATNRPFSIEIIGVKNQTLATFKFDPQKGKFDFVKGAINVDGPYFADAAKVNFYNDKGQLILTLDVSGSSFCNDDSICNSDVGENNQNCPADCVVATPSKTVLPPPSQKFLIFGLNLTQTLTWLGLIILALVIVWVIFKRFSKKRGIKDNIQPPQNVPPPQI